MKFNNIRKWSRNIHRDLSYIFTGMLIIYAISGIAMNHLKNSNPYYNIKRHEYKADLPIKKAYDISKEYVIENYLAEVEQSENYTKHYFPEPTLLKVFLKGGSNLEVDLTTNNVVFEELKPRHIVGTFTKMHYNPNKIWTWFSDIFAICMLIVILTGLVMVKGKRGLWGIGGIELLIGIAIPLIILFWN